eukprot:TRINITY_DN26678_c0_g3_i1.p1 TRINITY_DN26678_c0_g3~~TRINITY_DN26678_c0_g3_i1.p1  ORF type:complete len:947 (-),score=182.98 TRINITY_DN26678_c0_g3_i1:199-3039(-)
MAASQGLSGVLRGAHKPDIERCLERIAQAERLLAPVSASVQEAERVLATVRCELTSRASPAEKEKGIASPKLAGFSPRRDPPARQTSGSARRGSEATEAGAAHGPPSPAGAGLQLPVGPISEDVNGGAEVPQSAAIKAAMSMDQVVISSIEQHQDGALSTRSGVVSAMPTPKRLVPREAVSIASLAPKLQRSTTRMGMPFTPMIYPDSQRLLVWTGIGIFYIVFEAFAIPFNIAFDWEAAGWSFLFVSSMDLYFIIDICLTFITAYRNEADRLETNYAKIAKRYAKSWMVPDLASGIPWEWLPVRSKYGQLTKMTRMLRLARLLRLVKVSTSVSEKARMYLEVHPSMQFMMGVISVILLLVGVTHWTACGWYMVGSRTVDPGVTTWVESFVPAGSDSSTEYLYAVHFALTTMTTVGYGDITAKNPGEVTYVIFLLLIASIVFPYIMGKVADLLFELNNEDRAMSEKMNVLGKYMKWRCVPPRLFRAIRCHLQFLWETSKGFEEYEDDIMTQLPPVLRKELAYHIFGNVLRSVPFFAWMLECDACLKDLSNLIDNLILSRGDFVIRTGDPNDAIYVLVKGTVRVSLNDGGIDLLEDETHGDADDGETSPTQGRTFGLNIDAPSMEEIDAQSLPETALNAAEAIRKIQRALNLKSKERRTNRKKPPPSGDIFRSRSLTEARFKLMDEDEDRRIAAVNIQRLWRMKKIRRESGLSESHLHGHESGPSRSKQLGTTFMNAPAYFGESCLWIPYAEWDTTEPGDCNYNVRCESRCELVVIPREKVKEIIQRFSPWLEERFEMFREAVVSAIAADKGLVPSSKEAAPRRPSMCEGVEVGSHGGHAGYSGDRLPLPLPMYVAAAAASSDDFSPLYPQQMASIMRARATELAHHSRSMASRIDDYNRARFQNSVRARMQRRWPHEHASGRGSPASSLHEPLLGAENIRLPEAGP